MGQPFQVPFLLGSFVLSLCCRSVNLALLPTTVSVSLFVLPSGVTKNHGHQQRKKTLQRFWGPIQDIGHC